jgi:hypothetical protein
MVAMLEILILDTELLESAGALLAVPSVRTEHPADVEEHMRQ